MSAAMSRDDEQVPLKAGFAAWSTDRPVVLMDDVAAWLRHCAEKVETNADEWRSIDEPPDAIMADFLRDRAQGIDDYAALIVLNQDESEHPESGDSRETP